MSNQSNIWEPKKLGTLFWKYQTTEECIDLIPENTLDINSVDQVSMHIADVLVVWRRQSRCALILSFCIT